MGKRIAGMLAMLNMRSAAVLMLVVCSTMVASCGGAQSRLASHMRRGQEYFSHGDFAKANVEFRNAMQIAPKDPAARLMAAHTAEHLGQFGPAIGLYQSVVDSNPENVDARVSLGRLLTMAGAPQRGLDLVQPGLKQHPDDAELLTVQAAAKWGLNDEAGALADIERALKLAPTNEDAVALRANLYRHGGDYAGAISLVSTAVGQLPNSTSLREMLVSLYASAKEPTKAGEQLHALIDLKPAELRYRNQLAVLYARDSRVDDAQRVLEEAVKAFPKSDPAKLALVDFLSTARSSAHGEQVLQGFIAREPDDYDLRLHLAALMEASGKTKEAIAVYDEVVRRAGTEPMGLIARNKIAAIAVAQQRYEDAGKLIGQVLQKNPRDSDALRLRGQISLERHDPVDAIADFRAVLRDQPKAVGIQRLLARAHLENGESELAAEVLRSAQQSAPADNALRIDLAQLLLKMRRGDESVKLLEEGVRNAPADAALRESLVRAYLAGGNFAAARTGAEGLKTLRPTAAIGSFLAGLAAQGENQLDEAQKEFEHALALQPRSLEVLSALARLELARKHPEQAIARVKSAAERDSNAYSWNLLGELYLAQKNVPSASDALTRASKLSPTWWVPYRNLALARLVENDTPGAIAEYDGAIKAAPSESGLVTELASLLERQGRVDDAIKRYEASYAATHNRMIANNLAMLIVTYKKDRTSLDRARDLTRGFDSATEGDLLDTTGWVHFKRAEYADALPALERAAQRVPDSRVIHYHLGMAELQAGRTDRARVDLQTAVSGSATFPGADEARTALAALKSETG
jgi:tetratricopeptide (TPR) repeat protein